MLTLVVWLSSSLYIASAFAQGKKPQVLVFGDGIDAYTAAVQSAKSNLNTVWVTESNTLDQALNFKNGETIRSPKGIDSGIWMELLSLSKGSEAPNDSLAQLAKMRLDVPAFMRAADSLIRRFPHLSVRYGVPIRSAKKNKRTWRIQLNDRSTFTVRAVVDASSVGKIAQLAGLTNIEFKQNQNELSLRSADFSLLRTGVAIGHLQSTGPFTIPLGALVPTGDDNIFFTINTAVFKGLSTGNTNDKPLLAHIGQAVGASAAFVAFYKSSTSKIDVRQIQGEILQYGARLIPFQDILVDDPNFKAIQAVGATGLFRPILEKTEDGGSIDELNCLFKPDAPISTEEIRSTMNQLYSRSQVWFTDHQATSLSRAEFLSLIKYIALRGSELDALVERNWKRRWKLAGDYDAQAPITRREAAVLLHEYAKPFDVRVTMDGRILR